MNTPKTKQTQTNKQQFPKQTRKNYSIYFRNIIIWSKMIKYSFSIYYRTVQVLCNTVATLSIQCMWWNGFLMRRRYTTWHNTTQYCGINNNLHILSSRHSIRKKARSQPYRYSILYSNRKQPWNDDEIVFRKSKTKINRYQTDTTTYDRRQTQQQLPREAEWK